MKSIRMQLKKLRQENCASNNDTRTFSHMFTIEQSSSYEKMQKSEYSPRSRRFSKFDAIQERCQKHSFPSPVSWPLYRSFTYSVLASNSHIFTPLMARIPCCTRFCHPGRGGSIRLFCTIVSRRRGTVSTGAAFARRGVKQF